MSSKIENGGKSHMQSIPYRSERLKSHVLLYFVESIIDSNKSSFFRGIIYVFFRLNRKLLTLRQNWFIFSLKWIFVYLKTESFLWLHRIYFHQFHIPNSPPIIQINYECWPTQKTLVHKSFFLFGEKRELWMTFFSLRLKNEAWAYAVWMS